MRSRTVECAKLVTQFRIDGVLIKDAHLIDKQDLVLDWVYLAGELHYLRNCKGPEVSL